MSKGAARRDDVLLCVSFSALVFLVLLKVHSSFIAYVTIDYELKLNDTCRARTILLLPKVSLRHLPNQMPAYWKSITSRQT